MANVGAPLGNNNAGKAKRWEAALVRAIEAYPSPVSNEGCNDLMKGINLAASSFIKKMIEDENIAFFREFGDRLDGKSAQSVSVSGDSENPLTVSVIERVIIKAK